MCAVQMREMATQIGMSASSPIRASKREKAPRREPTSSRRAKTIRPRAQAPPIPRREGDTSGCRLRSELLAFGQRFLEEILESCTGLLSYPYRPRAAPRRTFGPLAPRTFRFELWPKSTGRLQRFRPQLPCVSNQLSTAFPIRSINRAAIAF